MQLTATDQRPAATIPVRSWLYVGADDLDAVRAALDSEADAVILDLEDMVAPSAKDAARRTVAVVAEAARPAGGPSLHVQIDLAYPDTAEEDIVAAVRPGIDGLRLPKVEDPGQVRRVSDLVARQEARVGLPDGSLGLVCNIESAVGVLAIEGIAAADPRVTRLGFGEADFTRDVGARIGPDQVETLMVRSRIVVASRAAGIGQPTEGAYLSLDDRAGLARTTRASRSLGFFGRSALTVPQAVAINEIFTPSAEEVATARAVMEAMSAATATGRGTARLDSGAFVDIAVARQAERTLALSAALDARRR